MQKSNGMLQLMDTIDADKNAIQQEIIKILAGHIKLEGNPNAARMDEQLREQSQRMMNAFEVDIRRGVQCFLDYTSAEEKQQLDKLFGKLHSIIQHQAGMGSVDPLTEDDYAFLDGIATRTLQEGHTKEASCQFRLIIQFNMSYSRAWVGWACAEQEMHHTEIVDQIFALATSALPYDAYIAAFASDYYLSVNKRDKAIQVLRDCIEFLRQLPNINPMVTQELNRQMAGI